MINFSINKNLFLQALNTTKRAISLKNAIPILSTVKIDVTNEGITLIGSNGQISIENFISIKNENAGLLVTSSGSILLEATFFINVVSSLPDVTLDFKEIEQKQIVLTSGKSEITLKGKDADQYPRIQEISASNPLVLETSVLKNIINETAFAASTQESRPILTGVHFVLTENKNLKTVATDSHRMSQKKIVLDEFHFNRGDNSEYMARSTQSRVKYKGEKFPVFNTPDIIKRGDVIIESDLYTRYAGELQIALKDMKNTGKSNVVAKIVEDELFLLDLIEPWSKFGFTLKK